MTEPAHDNHPSVTLVEIGGPCNNNCIFCSVRSAEFDISAPALMKKISAGAAAGSREIVFSGREPTMHPNLVALIARARADGYTRIRLETNGRMLAYEAYADKLAAAGITEAAFLFPAADAEMYGRLCGDATGFGQLIAAVRNMATRATAVARYATVPVLEENVATLSALAEAAADAGIEHITFFEIAHAGSTAARDIELFAVPVRDAMAVAESRGVKAAARGVLLEPLVRAAGPIRRCTECDDKDPRGATLFCPTFFVGRTAHPEVLEVLIRPNFSCNQICTFCWVDKNAPNPPHEEVLRQIAEITARRVPRVSFSGGEPTINPHLEEYVRLAKQGGVREIVLHTNAVRLADPAYAAALRAAGVDVAYVTILAPDAALSDSITRTVGTFRRTVAGALNLITAGVHTLLHFVIMKENIARMVEFVDFAHRTFCTDSAAIPITFSYVAPPLPDIIRHVPRFTDAAPHIRAAMARCRELGIPFGGNEGLKGIPPCALGGDTDYFRFLIPLPSEPSGEFVKKDDCARCRFDNVCFGVRRHYAENYGLDEIHPVTG